MKFSDVCVDRKSPSPNCSVALSLGWTGHSATFRLSLPYRRSASRIGLWKSRGTKSGIAELLLHQNMSRASWYFHICCIQVWHSRHSGHLYDFEVDGLMTSITSISPTGLVGLFGEDFPSFVRFCFVDFYDNAKQYYMQLWFFELSFSFWFRHR